MVDPGAPQPLEPEIPMTGSETSPPIAPEEPLISAAEFYEAVPPNRRTRVARLGISKPQRTPNLLATPDIQLHCSNDACNGIRFFGVTNGAWEQLKGTSSYHFVSYRCRNCQRTMKVYAITARLIWNSQDGEATKLGELPPFGPPTPARVVKLIGPDRELFLAGRRSENQGMGIGTFAYYRRVVENQKNRLLSEIIRVAEKIRAEESVLSRLRAARDETQFSKAVELAKDAIPQTLLINGHNPLRLLHSALSEGLHEQDDQQCLELATSIRVVLTELAERLGIALKDEAELNDAVTRLLKHKPDKLPPS